MHRAVCGMITLQLVQQRGGINYGGVIKRAAIDVSRETWKDHSNVRVVFR